MKPAGGGFNVFAPLSWVAHASARHPWMVLGLVSLIFVLALGSLSRLRVSASLETMLGSRSPAAAAFQIVLAEFHAGEAILAVVEPTHGSGATSQDQEGTVAFADAFVAALTTDPRTGPKIAWARAGQDPALAQFITGVIAPHAPYYIGVDGTQSLLDRFQPAQLTDQFRRNEALISAPGPAGGAISTRILQDPLRLFDLASRAGFALTAAPTAAASNGETGPAPERSIDGRAVLVRIAARASLNDLEEARALVTGVAQIAAELSERFDGGRFNVRLGGPSPIAATAAGTIRADAIVSTLVSIGLLYFLFVVFYRRWLTPLVIGLVACVGLVVGFGVHAVSAPVVSPLAAAVAALLAGLGVDYGIHFVSHFDDLRAGGASSEAAVAATAREMALPITTNCFTSIFGFASLWPSEIAMLSDFAKLGTAGLIGAWLASFTLLPALLVLTHPDRALAAGRPVPARPRRGGVADVVARRPRLWVSSLLSLTAVLWFAVAVRGAGPRLEGDLTVLHPRPNAALNTTDEIIARFAGQGEIVPVLVSVRDPADLLPVLFDAAAALGADHCKAVGVIDVLGLHRLLPDPRAVDEVTRLLTDADADSLIRNFDDALAGSAFEPAAYAEYRTFLTRLLRPASPLDPPGIRDLKAFPSIADRLLPFQRDLDRPPTQTVLVVRLAAPLRDRQHRAETVKVLRAALAAVPEATLAGLPVVSTELEEATARDLPRSIAISVTLVLIWLTLVFRRLLDVVMALTPLLFAASATVAVMAVTGARFNAINSIAIPLLDGIAVDAGVFLVAVARQARHDGLDRAALVARLRPTMHAVLLASATTVTGFASLFATHTPAIRSLGLIAAFGIAASFAAAAGILVPWILATHTTSTAKRMANTNNARDAKPPG